MLLEEVIRGEIVLWVDFNNLEDDDRLPTTLRYATGPRKPRAGDWVRIVDSDGDTCLAQVLRVEGMLVEVRPNWATWEAGAPEWATWAPLRQTTERTEDLRETLRWSREHPNEELPFSKGPATKSLVG
jgi:hypothetical protein